MRAAILGYEHSGTSTRRDYTRPERAAIESRVGGVERHHVSYGPFTDLPTAAASIHYLGAQYVDSMAIEATLEEVAARGPAHTI